LQYFIATQKLASQKSTSARTSSLLASNCSPLATKDPSRREETMKFVPKPVIRIEPAFEDREAIRAIE
jgi:hypothetical protein